MSTIGFKDVLLNLDTCLLALPVLVTGGIGVGATVLEKSDIPVLNTIGFLGARVCSALTVVVALPLLIANFVKTLFAQIANLVTCGKFETLKNYAEYTDKVYRISGYVIDFTPAIITHVTRVIGIVKTGGDFVKKATEVFNKIMDTIKQKISNTKEEGVVQEQGTVQEEEAPLERFPSATGLATASS